MSTKAGVERLFSTYSMVRSAIVGGYEGCAPQALDKPRACRKAFARRFGEAGAV